MAPVEPTWDGELRGVLRKLRRVLKLLHDYPLLEAATAQLAKADPLDFSAYYLQNGRVPVLGDEVPPWRYRGWLRHSVQLLHAAGAGRFPDRWGYYMRTLEAGKLLDEPIPQVRFENPNPATLREAQRWVELLQCRGASHWSAFSELVGFLAYGLAVSDDLPRIEDRTCEDLYRKVNLLGWLEHPSDYLGSLASERYNGGPLAFFPTPQPLVNTMAELVFQGGGEPGADPRTAPFSEPACGSGRMLLSASNYTMNIRGLDLDPLMVLASKINLAVYAPWGLHGLPFLRALDSPKKEVEKEGSFRRQAGKKKRKKYTGTEGPNGGES